jgi:hypothetical protein
LAPSSFVAGEIAVAQLSLFFGFFVVMIMGAICLQYGCLKVRLMMVVMMMMTTIIISISPFGPVGCERSLSGT